MCELYYQPVLVSLRMSICLSVKHVNCDKAKETSAKILMPYKKSIYLFLRHEEWLMGNDLVLVGTTDCAPR